MSKCPSMNKYPSQHKRELLRQLAEIHFAGREPGPSAYLSALYEESEEFLEECLKRDRAEQESLSILTQPIQKDQPTPSLQEGRKALARMLNLIGDPDAYDPDVSKILMENESSLRELAKEPDTAPPPTTEQAGACEIPDGGIQLRTIYRVGYVSRERIFTSTRLLHSSEISAILHALELDEEQEGAEEPTPSTSHPEK